MTKQRAMIAIPIETFDILDKVGKTTAKSIIEPVGRKRSSAAWIVTMIAEQLEDELTYNDNIAERVLKALYDEVVNDKHRLLDVIASQKKVIRAQNKQVLGLLRQQNSILKEMEE